MFLSLLTVLFIGLKIGGVITWSWWLVLLPLYGFFALLFIIVVIFGSVVEVLEVISASKQK